MGSTLLPPPAGPMRPKVSPRPSVRSTPSRSGPRAERLRHAGERDHGQAELLLQRARGADAIAVGELLDEAGQRAQAAGEVVLLAAGARQIVERVVAQRRLREVVGEVLERLGGVRGIVQIVEVDAADQELRVVELQVVVAAGDERVLARREDAAQAAQRALEVAARAQQLGGAPQPVVAQARVRVGVGEPIEDRDRVGRVLVAREQHAALEEHVVADVEA